MMIYRSEVDMKLLCRLDVPGKIHGKGRPRFSGRTGTVYTPKPTAIYENYIKTLFLSQFGAIQTDKPLVLKITAFLGIPKSTTKKERVLIEKGEKQPTKKPDIDNIIKVVLDALNGVAYIDDKQVIRVEATKAFGETESLHIEIYEFDNSF